MAQCPIHEVFMRRARGVGHILRDSVTYSITVGNDDGKFAIDASTGPSTIDDLSRYIRDIDHAELGLSDEVGQDGKRLPLLVTNLDSIRLRKDRTC